jgi:hypothetical protein
MKKQNIIHRTIDYFGIVYYGFLALYSLYELFFGEEYISIIVVGPLISAMLTIGTLYIILSPLYLFVPFREDTENPFEHAAGNFLLGAITVGVAALFISNFVTPEEHIAFIEPIFVIFIFITIAEILIRVFSKNLSNTGEKESLREKIEQAASGYPLGMIVIGFLILGFIGMILFYFPTLVINIPLRIFVGIGYFFAFFLLLDEVNKALGKEFRKDQSSIAFMHPDPPKQVASQEHPIRLWSSCLTLPLSFLFALATYLLLFVLEFPLTPTQYFIIVSFCTYVYLTWVRIKETRQHDHQKDEGFI